MKNPLKIYDDAMIYLAGKGVKGYNWLTGRRKSDLARQLLTGATVLEGAAACISDVPVPIKSLGVGVILAGGHFLQQKYKKDEELEDGMDESIYLDVITNRELYKLYGKLQTLFVFHNALLTKYYLNVDDSENSISHLLWASGFGLGVASFYIMAADQNPPKRDNVLKRAKDGLVEKLGNFQTPKLVPQPAQIYNAAQRVSEMAYAFA